MDMQSNASDNIVARTLMIGINLLIYVRSSTDEQSESCLRQLAEAERYLREKWLLPADVKLTDAKYRRRGVYRDEGVSGYKFRPVDRPESSELIRFCQENPRPAHDRGVIVIWSLSRLGRFKRGAAEAIRYLDMLVELGWEVRSITQPAINVADDNTRLLGVLQAAIAGEKDFEESKGKSEDIRSGKREAVEAGIWPGSIAPFGYTRWAARLEQTSEGRKIHWLDELRDREKNGHKDSVTLLRPSCFAGEVLQMYKWAADGDGGAVVSLAEIARRVMKKGIQTHRYDPSVPKRRPARSDGQGTWHAEVIRKILSNEAYVAVQRDRDRNQHHALWQPIVTVDLWNRVQAKLRTNQRQGRGVNTVYALSGLLFCAGCQSPLWGERASSGQGHQWYYRSKATPGSIPCEGCRRRIRVLDIERPVLDAIGQIADHPLVTAAIAEEQQARAQGASSRWNRVQQLKAQKAELERQIGNLTDSIAVGGAFGSAVRAKAEQLNRDVERLAKEMGRLLSPADNGTGPEQFANDAVRFADIFEAASPAERKSLVGAFAARIEVDVINNVVKVGIRELPRAA
jgi:DNA invertase Pin-like site-specific DNA recombinase